MDIVNKKSYTTLRKMIQRRAIKFNLNLLNNLLNYFHDSINDKNYKIIKKTKIFFIAKLIFFSILLYLIIYIIPFHWIMFVSIFKKKIYFFIRLFVTFNNIEYQAWFDLTEYYYTRVQQAKILIQGEDFTQKNS